MSLRRTAPRPAGEPGEADVNDKIESMINEGAPEKPGAPSASVAGATAPTLLERLEARVAAGAAVHVCPARFGRHLIFREQAVEFVQGPGGAPDVKRVVAAGAARLDPKTEIRADAAAELLRDRAVQYCTPEGEPTPDAPAEIPTPEVSPNE